MVQAHACDQIHICIVPGSMLYPNQKACRERLNAQVSTMSFFSVSVLNTASVEPSWHRSHWSAEL
jgi:hypothetical protein